MANNSNKNFQIILTALMIAMIFIAANIIRIPTIGGYIHLGDCMVLISVVVLDKRRAALASAIGMSLVDIFSGYIIWVPFTFIIKGLMAYIAGVILQRFKEKTIKAYFISFIVSGTFMIIAYFISGAIIAKMLTNQVNSFIAAIAYSAKDIIGNIVQVSIAIIIAVPLAKIISIAKGKIIQH